MPAEQHQLRVGRSGVRARAIERSCAPSARRTRGWALSVLVLPVLASMACRAEPPQPQIGGPGGSSVELPDSCERCTDLPAAPIFLEGADVALADEFAAGRASAFAPLPCIADPPAGAVVPSNWPRPRLRWLPDPAARGYRVTVSHPRQANELVLYLPPSPKPGPVELLLPAEVWSGVGSAGGLAARSAGREALRVRIAQLVAGEIGESESSLTVAPVPATGTLLFWSASDIDPGVKAGEGTSWLSGFRIGDESTLRALDLQQVSELTIGDRGVAKKAEYDVVEGRARCIGCHSSTPDGSAVVFADHWPWNMLSASVKDGSVGERPNTVTALGALLLNLPWQGSSTNSLASWGPAERIVVTSYGPGTLPRSLDALESPWSQGAASTNADQLLWIDVGAREAPEVPSVASVRSAADRQLIIAAYAADCVSSGPLQCAPKPALGVVRRDGDTRAAVLPDLSEDGRRLVYTSTDATEDGHLGAALAADIFVVPFGAERGGKAAPVPGAADREVLEYYPDLSRCGVGLSGTCPELLLFNRVAEVDGSRVFYRPDGELWVVPTTAGLAPAPGEIAKGGAVRLRANDPGTCGWDATAEVAQVEQSPGVLNSWGKWAPRVERAPDGTLWYFLVMSSARDAVGLLPQTQFSPPDRRASQLFLTAVSVTPEGLIRTWPAVYLWNQQQRTETGRIVTNLTPAWDDLEIPYVAPPIR